MEIIFQGEHNTEEAAESLLSILKMLRERYGISHFNDLSLQMNLMDEEGEALELIDMGSQEVLGVLEVYKNAGHYDEIKNSPPGLASKPSHIKLVVDNTKPS